MKKDNIDKFLAMTMTMGNTYSSSYTDDVCFFDYKLLGYSTRLACEIDDLLEEGYTKEEISTLIRKSDFTLNNPDLTEEEGEYLKERAFYLLEIRYKLFNEKSIDNNFSKSLTKKNSI